MATFRNHDESLIRCLLVMTWRFGGKGTTIRNVNWSEFKENIPVTRNGWHLKYVYHASLDTSEISDDW